MQGIFTHKFSFLIFIFLIFLSSKISFAQDFTFKFDNSLKITQNGQNLTNPFAGGFNAPQFSTCKLDKDGIEDLVVFDRTAQKLYTFLAKQDNTGKYFWQYAPQYENAFPKFSTGFYCEITTETAKKTYSLTRLAE